MRYCVSTTAMLILAAAAAQGFYVPSGSPAAAVVPVHYAYTPSYGVMPADARMPQLMPYPQMPEPPLARPPIYPRHPPLAPAPTMPAGQAMSTDDRLRTKPPEPVAPVKSATKQAKHTVPKPGPTIEHQVSAESEEPPMGLGWLLKLESVHSMLNYAVPVHYPRSQPRGYRFYGNAYYLQLWAKQQTAPVLFEDFFTGQPAVGGNGLDFERTERMGWRGTLGCWLDHGQTWAIEAATMGFAKRESTFAGTDLVHTVAGPVPVNADIAAWSQMWTVEGNLRRELLRGCYGHIDCLVGVRYLELDEALNILSDFGVEDFRTENAFLGGQFGVDAELVFHHLAFNFWSKFGLGNNQQTVTVAVVDAEDVAFAPAGVRRRNKFTFVAEAGAFMHLKLSTHLRLSAGYTILFINNAARPGDQIDPAADTFQFGDSGFWVHGLNAGFQFRF